jgi:superfamily II DNA or RNA helicase
MGGISLKTTQRIIPMIYAYSTPEIKRHDGWLKIGYTDKQTVEQRVKQQGHTVDVIQKIEWKGNAIFDDGSGDTFTDHDFRNYLKKNGVEVMKGLEYCHISVPDSLTRFYEYRSTRGVIPDALIPAAFPYELRVEQEKAASETMAYAREHENGSFLWNAKPRFGKTLTTYDLIMRMKAERVLIVTKRPAIANSWYSDYAKFVGRTSGYFFVSSVDGIKDKPFVMSHEDYENDRRQRQTGSGAKPMGLIEFVSLQDMKGAIEFGGKFDKLKHLAYYTWDLLVIDEAHEGVDTYRTDVAFDHIKRRFTLHLSGTPFKALANDKFPQEAIFNWTYADEQQAKRDWNGDESNPYEALPKLNLFTYQMSEIIKDELSQGIEIKGETEEYAFDLNEFFATDGNGRFKHNESVDRFLDALTTQEKFPFSTPELRNELRHTFWLLNRVDSARALARKLDAHPVFGNGKYKIVLAAGDGNLDDEKATEDSFKRVRAAIEENEYTITLSVGQLTTGVTIPEWTAVLMLSNVKSPALYMQAAFRAQNPHIFKRGTQYLQKESAYVFDFDPARTLTIFEQFANDLSAETSDGRGDLDTRRENIRTLLNFFPVIGEDENGEMIELDAEKVLSIPRRIRCQEVVRRGFMSDFLFQNVANVFHAPQEVIDIIKQFNPVAEPKAKINITEDTADRLAIDENGEVSLSDDYVIGTTQDIFGDKIYDVQGAVQDAIIHVPPTPENDEDAARRRLSEAFKKAATDPLLDTAKEHYGSELRPSDKKRLERKIEAESQRIIDRAYGDFSIESKKAEKERDDLLELARTQEERKYVQDEYEKRKREVAETLTKTIQDAIPDFVQTAAQDIARSVETAKKEKEKKDIESSVKDHLRGFSRTIPSFLMAYGSDAVTLDTFDKIIPADVFKAVTSITLEQFVFLRDGGEYTDENTGETKMFGGHLFDPVVFDDSVREFMRLRTKLADYFDESNTEDIFDYVPPQKTNQIFTPRHVVSMMVDMLEENNPGCFDDPTKKFADLYMKSGLYITEIVKRLYRSEKIKAVYPNDKERIRHILRHQVYGMAPTRIIYLIATNYILGFDEELKEETHNFVECDAAEASKQGTLKELVDTYFTP